MQLTDNSTGRVVAVTSEFQLKTVSENHELQHHNAWEEGQTYQVLSVDTGITAKTQTILHIKNTDSSRLLVVSFIRMQGVGLSATLPGTGDYFQLGLHETVASGGTVTTAVNTNAQSGNSADVVATGVDPTMGGSFTEIDRQYIKADGDEYSFNKHGSIILGFEDTVSVRLVSSGTGTAKARITFMMIQKDR